MKINPVTIKPANTKVQVKDLVAANKALGVLTARLDSAKDSMRNLVNRASEKTCKEFLKTMGK